MTREMVDRCIIILSRKDERYKNTLLLMKDTGQEDEFYRQFADCKNVIDVAHVMEGKYL